MNAMRRAIAEHMIRSIQTSAHVTTVFEIDMAKVVAIREKLKREYADRTGSSSPTCRSSCGLPSTHSESGRG